MEKYMRAKKNEVEEEGRDKVDRKVEDQILWRKQKVIVKQTGFSSRWYIIRLQHPLHLHPLPLLHENSSPRSIR